MSEFHPSVLFVVDSVATIRESIAQRGRCRSVQTALAKMSIPAPAGLKQAHDEAVAAERHSRLRLARASLADASLDDEAALHFVRLAAFGTGPALQVIADLAQRVDE